MEYKTEVYRDDQCLQVYGELWEDGSGYWDEWDDTGRNFEITHEPEFSITEVYLADTMQPIRLTSLTPKEMYCIIDAFTEQYWDQYIHD